MRETDSFGEMRSLIMGEPGVQNWFRLTRVFSAFDVEEQRDAVIPYAKNHLNHKWPDAMRPIPAWVHKQKPQDHPWLSLCKTITIDEPVNQTWVKNLLKYHDDLELTHFRLKNNSRWRNYQDPKGVLTKILGHRAFSKLRALLLPDSIFQEDDDLLALLALPTMHHLEELKNRNHRSLDFVNKLMEHPCMATLKHLDLGSAMDANAMVQMLNHPNCPRLRSISPSATGLNVIEKMAGSPQMAELEYLSLYNQRIGNEGVQTLLNSEHTTNIRYLNIGGCGLNQDAYDIIAQARSAKHLELLWIWSCTTTPEGLDALLNSDNVPSLQRLNLNNNNMERRHFEVIQQSALWPQIKSLYVNSSGFDSARLSILLERDEVLALEDFESTSGRLSEHNYRRLATHPGLGNLKRLHISSTGIDDALIQNLKTSQTLKNLTYVSLAAETNSLTDRLWPMNKRVSSGTYEAKRYRQFSDLCTHFDFNFDVELEHDLTFQKQNTP